MPPKDRVYMFADTQTAPPAKDLAQALLKELFDYPEDLSDGEKETDELMSDPPDRRQLSFQTTGMKKDSQGKAVAVPVVKKLLAAQFTGDAEDDRTQRGLMEREIFCMGHTGFDPASSSEVEHADDFGSFKKQQEALLNF